MALYSTENKAQLSNSQIALRVALGLMVLAITVLLILNRDKVQALQQYGYVGIFLFSVLSNATIIFPLPGVFLRQQWVQYSTRCGWLWLLVQVRQLASFLAI